MRILTNGDIEVTKREFNMIYNVRFSNSWYILGFAHAMQYKGDSNIEFWDKVVNYSTNYDGENFTTLFMRFLEDFK